MAVLQAVVPVLLERGEGAIVLVGARSALRGGAGSGAYSAAKGALLRLAESLAAEVGPRGIRVNAVLPGTLDTPQNRAAMPEADPSRWTTPEAAAEAIAFLLSEEARAVRGVGLPLGG